MLPPSLDDLRRRQQQPAPSLQKQRARGRDRVADALPKPNAVIRKPTAAGAASSASQARPKPEPESESELEPGQPPDKAMHARLEPQPEPNSAGAGKGQTQLEKRKKQQSPRAPLLPSLDDLRGRQQQPAPSLQKQRARIKTFEIVRAKLLMRAKVWALSDQNLKDTWDEHLKASASRHRLQYGTYQRGPTLGRNEAEDRQEKTMTNKAPKTREKKYKERGTIDLRGCSPFDGGNSIEQVNPVWWRRLRSIGLNRRFITEQHLNDPSLNRTAGRYVGDGKGSNCFTPYDFSENNEPLIIIIDGEYEHQLKIDRNIQTVQEAADAINNLHQASVGKKLRFKAEVDDDINADGGKVLAIVSNSYGVSSSVEVVFEDDKATMASGAHFKKSGRNVKKLFGDTPRAVAGHHLGIMLYLDQLFNEQYELYAEDQRRRRSEKIRYSESTSCSQRPPVGSDLKKSSLRSTGSQDGQPSKMDSSDLADKWRTLADKHLDKKAIHIWRDASSKQKEDASGERRQKREEFRMKHDLGGDLLDDLNLKVLHEIGIDIPDLSWLTTLTEIASSKSRLKHFVSYYTREQWRDTRRHEICKTLDDLNLTDLEKRAKRATASRSSLRDVCGSMLHQKDKLKDLILRLELSAEEHRLTELEHLSTGHLHAKVPECWKEKAAAIASPRAAKEQASEGFKIRTFHDFERFWILTTEKLFEARQLLLKNAQEIIRDPNMQHNEDPDPLDDIIGLQILAHNVEILQFSLLSHFCPMTRLQRRLLRAIFRQEQKILREQKDHPRPGHLLTWPRDLIFDCVVPDFKFANPKSVMYLHPSAGMHTNIPKRIMGGGAKHEFEQEQLELLMKQLDANHIEACIELQMYLPLVRDFTGDTGLLDGERGLGSIQKLVRMAYFKLDSPDCAHVIARQLSDGDSTLPNMERVCFDFTECEYTDEVWPIFELVLSNLTRSHKGPIEHFTIECDADGELYKAFGELAFDEVSESHSRLHRLRTAQNLVFSDGRAGPRRNAGFLFRSHKQTYSFDTMSVLGITGYQLCRSRVLTTAVYMAARCRALVEMRPQEGDHMLRLAGDFERFVDGLLGMCRSKHEAERLLQDTHKTLGGSAIVDYVVHHKLRLVAGNRWFQQYLKDVWNSPGLLKKIPSIMVHRHATPCFRQLALWNEGPEAESRRKEQHEEIRKRVRNIAGKMSLGHAIGEMESYVIAESVMREEQLHPEDDLDPENAQLLDIIRHNKQRQQLNRYGIVGSMLNRYGILLSPTATDAECKAAEVKMLSSLDAARVEEDREKFSLSLSFIQEPVVAADVLDENNDLVMHVLDENNDLKTLQLVKVMPLLMLRALLTLVLLIIACLIMCCIGTRRGKCYRLGGYRLWRYSRGKYLDYIERPFSKPVFLHGSYCCFHILFCYALANLATGSWAGPFDTSRATQPGAGVVNVKDLVMEIYVGVHGLGMFIAEGLQILRRFRGWLPKCCVVGTCRCCDISIKCCKCCRSRCNCREEFGDHPHYDRQGRRRPGKSVSISEVRYKLQKRFTIWNYLDLVIIALIGHHFYTMFSSWLSSQLETETVGTAMYDGLVIVSGQENGGGGWMLSTLILVVTIRTLELLLVFRNVGPLVIMILQMGDDIVKFSVLCAFCVIGFALAIVPLAVDPLNPVTTPLRSTVEHLLGIIGEQDMDAINEKPHTMGMYSLYLFAMQVILLNLLIAMFSSTYERVQESSLQEWEFELASRHIEFSFEEVQSIAEVPPMSILNIPFQILRCVRKTYSFVMVQCCNRCCNANTDEEYVMMPWDTEQEQVVRVHVLVPAGLKSRALRTQAREGTEPHRIIQFRHQCTQQGDKSSDQSSNKSEYHTKFVIVQIPHGVPPGSYVPVEFSRHDLEHASVKVVRGTVPRVIRHDAQPKVKREARAYRPNPPATGAYIAVRHKRESIVKGEQVEDHRQIPLRYGRIIDSGTCSQACAAEPGSSNSKYTPSTNKLTGIDYVQIEWLDSVNDVLAEDTRSLVPFKDLVHHSIVFSLGDLAVEYVFKVSNESTADTMCVRACMSATDSSYVTKMSPDEYMHNEDLGEVIRERWADSERDQTPDGIDELCERSWPRSFTAEDLREEIAANKKSIAQIGVDINKLSTQMNNISRDMSKV